MEKKLRMMKERKTGKAIKESCTICLFSILPFFVDTCRERIGCNFGYFALSA